MRELDLAEAVERLLAGYKVANKARLDADPSFAAWLETQYVPIVGAWQY
jgi:hypothetical protein